MSWYTPRPATCHPEKMEYRRGLCVTCYRPLKRWHTKPIPKDDIKLKDKVEGKLTLDDLTREVAHLNQMSYREARKLVFTIFGVMIRSLRNKEEVSVKGFGKFYLSLYSGYTQYRPNLGIYHEVPDRLLVKFRATNRLRSIKEEPAK